MGDLGNLVITFEQGSSIYIGDDIEICLLKAKTSVKNGVRIAIKAPKDINIVRDKVLRNLINQSKQTRRSKHE